MKAELKELGALPVKTWRWLGVNGGTVNIETPKAHEYTGNPLVAGNPLTAGGQTGAEIREMRQAGADKAEENRLLPLHAEMLEFVRAGRNTGYDIHILPGKKPAEPIVLDYRLGKDGKAVIDDSRIVAEEGSEVTVVMHYTSENGVFGLHCGLTRLIAKRGAKIRLVKIQTLSGDDRSFDTIGAAAEENAQIEVVQAELGAHAIRADCRIRLMGDGSRFRSSLLYFGDLDRTVDLSVVCEHFGKKTRSDIEARGALLDSSDKIFRGTIDFKKGSSGSVGRENEKVMLFSPTIRNRTAPLILCAEEDVDGRHSASAGRVNENQMFYLMSRGLTALEAKKLLIEAEFRPVIEAIPSPAFRGELSEFIQKRLNNVEKI